MITDEGEGPGPVMTLDKTASRVAQVPASLRLRAHPMGAAPLERVVERRVARPLEGAEGVTGVDKSTAAYGEHAGYLVVSQREYASGPYKTAVFAFSHGADAFLVELSVPAEDFDRERGALEAFAASIRFR